MPIENLKQIAIKYATTKGSRGPLAPDELCNAVVQYFNEFLKITADINTLQVAVTEEGGNIVFTITGNTLDGKAFTPIVITVDHNDFVTDQEFEEFKTTTNAAIQKNTESINSLSFRVEDTENDITTIQVQVGQINTRVGNTETNIAKINSTLNNKLDKVSSTTGVPQVYVKEYNGTQTMLDLSESTRVNSIPKRSPSGRMYTDDGISSEPSSVANMRNIAAVESKIPDISNLATTEQLQEVENKIPDTSNLATKTELQEVESKIPDTTNFAAAIQKNTESINSLSFRVEDTENDITTIQVQVGQINTRVGNTETNIAKINSTLNNKLDKVSSTTGVPQVYVKEYNGTQTMLDLSESTRVNSIPKRSPSGRMYTDDGISSEPSSVANMRNIAAVESKIPDISNLATTEQLQEVENKIPDTSNLATKTELQEVESKIPDTTNFADVTKANTFADVNHFTQYITSFGVEIGPGNADDDEYDVSIQESGIEIFHYISGSKANSLRITENKIMTVVYPSNEYNIFNFPNKSGTLALTSDIIKNPIYFISFYANEPSEPCHLIGTMMSKNSYGTGQKTNEEFAVMLADNLYTNSNEGLAAYGKLAEKDILCIYSEDGLSIRCLDEANSEVDLPTVMFFVTETEL